MNETMPHHDERPWIVLKFGGTSVATARCWERIVDRIREVGRTHRVWVVASAVAGHTDLLERAVAEAAGGGEPAALDAVRGDCLRLAAEAGLEVGLLAPALSHLDEAARRLEGARLSGEAPPRLTARILAAGERVSTRIGAAILEAAGISVTWVDATRLLAGESGAGEPEAKQFLEARVHPRRDPGPAEALAGGAGVVITQGFLARTADGDVCLLGRGGSDTSAASMAVLLDAERLEIWSDVHGIFTADPALIPTARLIQRISYREALELAALGAKVLHPRCLEIAAAAGIPLQLRCIEDPGHPGSRVERSTEDHAVVTAVTCRKGVTLLSVSTLAMWHTPGFLARMFAPFERLGFSIDLLATSQSAVSLTLDAVPGGVDGRRFAELIEDLEALGMVRAVHGCAVVSILGRRIRTALHEIGAALDVFEERPVHMLTDSSEDLNLSFVVDEADAAAVVTKLHERLFASRGDDPRLGPTWDMLRKGETPEPVPAGTWWRRRRGELLALMEDGRPRYVYEPGVVRERARALIEKLPAVERFYYAMKANSHPAVLEAVADAGFGMECVSAAEVDRVRDVLGGDCPVLFTPNFCPLEEYERALACGARVILDGTAALDQAPDLFEGVSVGLRLDPGRGRGHHRKVRTAGADSKFGMPRNDLEAAAGLLRRRRVRVTGLHAHVGSGILTPGTWVETGAALIPALEFFPEVGWLNLGGGLGVPEKPGQHPLDLDDLQDRLDGFREAAGGPALWMEPGRYLVSEAGVLLATVTQVRDKEGLRFAGINTGMNSLIRPALYGAWHSIRNLSRLDEAPEAYWQIVGPICETGDVLGRDRWITDPRPGDVLLIENAGAYAAVMASRYNLREPAEETVLRDR